MNTKILPEHFFLRISLTGGCNLACMYCNPNRTLTTQRDITTKQWIQTLEAASNLGIRSVHYTGGEPTIRPDLIEIVSAAKTFGYKEQIMTTNGVRIAPIAEKLSACGLNRVNISIDTLSTRKFNLITGVTSDVLQKQLDGLSAAVNNFELVKLNTVVMSNNYDEIPELVQLAQNNNIVLKLMELMEFGDAFEYDYAKFERLHISREKMVAALEHLGPLRETNVTGHNGVARYYFVGKNPIPIGIYAPHSEGYPCAGKRCGRIRISPNGYATHCVNLANSAQRLIGPDIDLLETMQRMEAIIQEKITWRKQGMFPEKHRPAYTEMRQGIVTKQLTSV